MKKALLSAAAVVAILAMSAPPALAQATEITVGISITTTGPAAALGIPERNALDFVPKEIAGVPVKVTVLDDGGDPTNATTNARRFVTESKADIIMGSSTTPPSIAVSNVANEAGIPHIGLAPFPITPDRAQWSVSMPQPIPIMGKVLYAHMKAHNIKTVGYIGYSDSYGDLWFNDFKFQAVPMGMTMVDEERFARPDTSVAGQALKLVAANPDAILIGASGTAAGLPQAELRNRGYKGLIYQTHGAASMDFIRIAGKAAEGVLMASGPVMDPEDQPDSALTRKPGLALNTAYEAKYGPNSRSQFAGHSYDAFEVLKRVIPVALKTAKPGTPEFREARRKRRLNPACTLVLEAEIACGDALVGCDVSCGSAQDEFAELHHIGAIGDLERGLRVLLDQQHRNAAGAQLADNAENVGDD